MCSKILAIPRRMASGSEIGAMKNIRCNQPTFDFDVLSRAVTASVILSNVSCDRRTQDSACSSKLQTSQYQVNRPRQIKDILSIRHCCPNAVRSFCQSS